LNGEDHQFLYGDDTPFSREGANLPARESMFSRGGDRFSRETAMPNREDELNDRDEQFSYRGGAHNYGEGANPSGDGDVFERILPIPVGQQAIPRGMSVCWRGVS
jgi:hypothetical protein